MPLSQSYHNAQVITNKRFINRNYFLVVNIMYNKEVLDSKGF